jgi:hypothetical protein
MPSLLEPIHALTETVLARPGDLDNALVSLEEWFDEHADSLTPQQRQSFSAALDVESTNDDRSLIDSVLKLHMTRLLLRFRATRRARGPPSRRDWRKARILSASRVSTWLLPTRITCWVTLLVTAAGWIARWIG